ncbi:MAG: M20/M25/M40 family metallo-hydrolase [Gemmatimonadota bacterium]
MRCLAALPILLVPITALLAQTGARAGAAATITEADVRRRIFIIADDSMGGRDTPSRGLDLTSQYVASEFNRLGLKPAGDSGGYVQHYPITVAERDPDSSFVSFAGPNGQQFKLLMGPDFGTQGPGPASLVTAPVVLVGGPFVPAKLKPEDVKDKIVIWVRDWSKGVPPETGPAVVNVLNHGAKGFIALVNSDSLYETLGGGGPAQSTVRLGHTEAGPTPSGPLFAFALESSVLGKVPEAADQFAQLRAATEFTVVPLADWSAAAITKLKPPQHTTAPNTVAILEGSDPALKKEYVVISAHMDHVGSACKGYGPQDRICNGADDDGSGTAGVIELAEAMAQPGARPKRSVIFLTVSGEEKGLYGSSYFSQHPPVDIKSIVADLNIDMIGRNWKDSVVAIGKAHSDLGKTVDEITRVHPELGMTVADDLWPSENLYSRSDHYNFAVRGVPVLFFTSGLHADYHAVSDSPDKIDAEKEARILKLIFYLAEEVGNRTERPMWKPESYKKIVTAQ